MKIVSYLFFALSLVACQPKAGQAQIRLDSTLLTVDTVISGIDIPWEISWGADNHIWMTERYGRISRVNPTTGQQQVLATLTDVTAQSESGLLGLVLHPNFVDTPWVFVAYRTAWAMRFTVFGSITKQPVGKSRHTDGSHTGKQHPQRRSPPHYARP